MTRNCEVPELTGVKTEDPTTGKKNPNIGVNRSSKNRNHKRHLKQPLAKNICKSKSPQILKTSVTERERDMQITGSTNQFAKVKEFPWTFTFHETNSKNGFLQYSTEP